MFKNMMMYRIQPGWDAQAVDMEAALDKARFEECGASQEKSIGWVEPRVKNTAHWSKVFLANEFAS